MIFDINEDYHYFEIERLQTKFDSSETIYVLKKVLKIT